MAKAVHSNEHVRAAANITALELAFKEKNRLDYLLYEHVRGLAAASRSKSAPSIRPVEPSRRRGYDAALSSTAVPF